MAVAAQIASWGRRWPHASIGPLGLQAGIPPDTFGDGQTLLGITVELLINGVWIDISGYVMYEQKIVVTRGRGNEDIESTPATCTFTLVNSDRRFSPRNTSGPYFGSLGRNVKVRVSANPGSNTYRQFTGRVTEWPQQIVTGDARFVAITASGQLRRLQQGNSPIKSALERATVQASPIALWRMSDVAVSPSQLAEALGGGTDLVASPGVTIGSTVTGPDGAPDSFPELMTSSPTFGTAYTASVLASSTDTWTIDLISKGFAGPNALTVIIPLQWTTSYMVWNIQMTASDDVIIQGTDTTSTDVALGANIAVMAAVAGDQGWHHYRITCEDLGSTIRCRLYIDGSLAATNTATGSAGKLATMQVDLQTTDADTDSASMGYLTLYAGLTGSAGAGSATDGWQNELATERFARLCTEEGIDYAIIETLPENFTSSSSDFMGPQRVATLLENLKDCRDVAEGVLDEDLDDNLRLTTKTAFYDREARLVLDYNAQILDMTDFNPTDDDALIRNDWTISWSGSTNPQQYELTTGPMNVSQPEDDPEGVGRYDDSATLSLSSIGGDHAALAHAAYRVARGTVDKVRFTSLSLWLEQDPGFIVPWMSRDPIGARILLQNSPNDIGGGTQDQNIAGYQVVMDQFTYHITMNTVPDDVNKTSVLNSIGFLDSRATTVTNAADSTQTTIDIETDGEQCVWVHTTGDYNIIIGGEVMTVTAVSAATGPGLGIVTLQTFTVVRSVNGVVKSHAIGEQVRVFDPFRTIL